ncbi:MAG: hypothetical protein IJZ36_01325 [Bacilli bacterium]|jgi:hypothetical protein|nr:hypothetical protein [Bacilli bacterium]
MLKDKVICIFSNDVYAITIGREYHLIAEGKTSFIITDDDGDKYCYPKRLFIKL